MTQKELSAKTGITQADISRIENGTRNPSLSMVKKLARGLQRVRSVTGKERGRIRYQIRS